ncbi:MAG: hydroxymyristoyl-ACP dehydratase [Flavobacteriaceae bacterium]|nr:hydroxymyristoyl-ACP dehydratase [Flavobacteriaceae bacterium]
MDSKNNLIDLLPYGPEFRFVDLIHSVSESEIVGEFTFRKSLSFYQHHFLQNPVTPGVILVECMAQIGLVCLGIYLTQQNTETRGNIALSNANIDFLHPVLLGEKVTVRAAKVYFRFGKLKCNVSMENETGLRVCAGTLEGVAIPNKTKIHTSKI